MALEEELHAGGTVPELLLGGPQLPMAGWEWNSTSGKHWKELPDDYMVPAGGFDPSFFCIIVGGGDEEVSHQLSSHRHLNKDPFYSIDAWR